MDSNLLVIGATGNVGKELVNLIAKNGQKYRIMFRSSSNTDTAEVSHAIEEIPGQKATTFKTFANDYREVFVG